MTVDTMTTFDLERLVALHGGTGYRSVWCDRDGRVHVEHVTRESITVVASCSVNAACSLTLLEAVWFGPRAASEAAWLQLLASCLRRAWAMHRCEGRYVCVEVML